MNGASLESAYAFCRAVAKREAKNFYYAFRVLPKAKSDAMCAVYAFMRRADDIADDESVPAEERRNRMLAWVESWRSSRVAATSDDPVFQALGDTQRRFGIPDDLLEQLVDGTTMDLQTQLPGTVCVKLTTLTASTTTEREFQAYETFEDLYRYCYLVASVVGLVCIRIFGYSDPAAEVLAEKCGIAFQLTNILRDIKEDAERGRIYVPLELLREFDVTPEDLLGLAAGVPMRQKDRAMLIGLSVQAWEYYEAGRALIPLLAPDSRAAMWVLVEIYSGLLARIDARDGDVFSSRVSVPARQKIFSLVRGAAMAVRERRG